MFKIIIINICVIIIAIKCDKTNVVDSLRTEFINLEKSLWNDILDSKHLNIDDPQSVERAGVEIIKQFKTFDDKLKAYFPNSLEYGLEFLERLWSWEIIRTYELINTYNVYETFRREQLHQMNNANSLPASELWTDFTKRKLQDFRFNAANNLGKRIQEIIFNENLLESTVKEANSDLCNLRQSPQQLLYNLYSTLAVTELKGYAMMQFSYMLMKLYNKGNMTREVELMREGYEERTERMIEAVKNVMQTASRDLWICDPKKHIRGETYIEVTQLLQGYIENEVDLNSENTCRETCWDYTYTKSYSCYKDLYCKQQRQCKGKIINCKYFDADMWICPGNPNSGRRYEYIEYENGRTLGQKDQCAAGTTKVDSWWRWLFWRCSYCFCLCDEPGVNSDRYFNLRNVEADVLNNKVITGLRFTKVNRIIHLQIQQGELMPKGRINPDSLEWVPVDSYSLTDRHAVEGQDYHKLSWEARAIDLDELKAQPHQILTGVRFRKIGSHLNFEIQARPFNFTNGQLIDPKNQYEWIGNDNTDGNVDNPRRQLRLNNPDVPTRQRSQSAPTSRSNQFLHFTNTAIDKDAAQTTVPFIDAQPVVPQIPIPLSGAGIYHKGQFGFGGYIAPKVITFDYSPHITPPPKIYFLKESKSEALNVLHDAIITHSGGEKNSSNLSIINLLLIYQIVKFLINM